MLIDTMIYVLLILISIQFPRNFAWSHNRRPQSWRKSTAPLVAAPPSDACKVLYQRILIRKPLEEGSFQLFTYLLSSITLYTRKQNGYKIADCFIYIFFFSKKYYLIGNHMWPTLFVKSADVVFKLK